jgi:hypothetical protein
VYDVFFVWVAHLIGLWNVWTFLVGVENRLLFFQRLDFIAPL